MNIEASLDKAFTANCHTGVLIWTCYQGLSNTREVLITVIFSWSCLVRDVVVSLFLSYFYSIGALTRSLRLLLITAKNWCSEGIFWVCKWNQPSFKASFEVICSISWSNYSQMLEWQFRCQHSTIAGHLEDTFSFMYLSIFVGQNESNLGGL